MMIFDKDLRRLKDQSSKDGYLTIYLSTDQTSNDQQKGEWKIRLKNGLKKLEEYNKSIGEKDLAVFNKMQNKAIKEIHKLQTELPKGIIFIVAANGEFLLKKLQIQVENEFYWEKEPILTQLEKIRADYPLEGILFIQKEGVFAIETSIGEVKHEMVYELDIENDDWRKQEGVAATERMASSANHRDKYEQRFEANQHRWFKALANTLQKEARSKGWNTIYLLGEEELTSVFENYLQFSSVKKMNKNYKKFSSKEIVGQVLAS